jgi:ureidoglycolate lyase
MKVITQPLTAEAFAPFGEVLDCAGDSITINQGNCQRFHDLAALDAGGGQVGVSIFHAKLRELPYQLDLMERHPLGTQAFIPMSSDGFLILVADDNYGRPDNVQAFVSAPNQGINLHKNTWHGVLTPLAGSGMFVVVDRVGEGDNLEEFTLSNPVTIDVSRA